jgi:hypothetical protein
MVTRMMAVVRRLPVAAGSAALMLGLALSGGCASGSSSHPASTSSSGMTSEELYNEYDQDNNNQIDQNEWDGAYRSMDANGDGVVTHDEFNGAMGGRR